MSRCQVWGCPQKASFRSEMGFRYCTTHRVLQGSHLKFTKITLKEEENESMTLKTFLKGED